MAEIKPSEVTAILRQQLENFNQKSEMEEVGTVQLVGDGIARVYGLHNVRSGELVEFRTKNGDEITCSRSMLGEIYEPIADPEPVPEDLVIPDEPTYTAVPFEDDWDIMEFALTFADGETVKYIRVTANEDEIPELPEFGLFTISGCEGGLLSDTCNTLTLMVSDNDAHGESKIGFADEAITANREDGFVKAKIARSGDKTYNITVHYETADGTAMIPLHEDFILSVDPEAGEIVMDLPAGLI